MKLDQLETQDEAYPEVKDLAMLAAKILTTTTRDENGDVGYTDEDYTAAAFHALGLWRAAEKVIHGAKKVKRDFGDADARYLAEQRERMALYGRMKTRVAEMPSPGETWNFGKVASKIVPPGIGNAPHFLRQLLEKANLPIVDEVDFKTCEFWGILVEREIVMREAAQRSQDFKDKRAIGIAKQKTKKQNEVDATIRTD